MVAKDYSVSKNWTKSKIRFFFVVTKTEYIQIQLRKTRKFSTAFEHVLLRKLCITVRNLLSSLLENSKLILSN